MRMFGTTVIVALMLGLQMVAQTLENGEAASWSLEQTLIDQGAIGIVALLAVMWSLILWRAYQRVVSERFEYMKNRIQDLEHTPTFSASPAHRLSAQGEYSE